MNELFDTTTLRTGAALRRHLTAADTRGQGDLFDAPAEDVPAGPVVHRIVTACVAINSDGSGNVYVMGANCRYCDDTFDPYFRTGVPCVNAYWHARHAVDNWQRHGVTDSRVVTVMIAETGEPLTLAEVVDRARRAAADAVTVWPAPVGAFWARDDLTGAAMLA